MPQKSFRYLLPQQSGRPAPTPRMSGRKVGKGGWGALESKGRSPAAESGRAGAPRSGLAQISSNGFILSSKLGLSLVSKPIDRQNTRCETRIYFYFLYQDIRTLALKSRRDPDFSFYSNFYIKSELHTPLCPPPNNNACITYNSDWLPGLQPQPPTFMFAMQNS